MYIPKHYIGKDNNAAVAFMQRFNFASIITSVNNIPIATHLPFVISKRGDEIILTSHFARANNHWEHITENKNLIIFSEPHAYISPSNYEQKENVPTWNYLSVHAYGFAKIIDNESEVTQVLEIMMDSFEPSYKDQWHSLSKEYQTRMSKGIVAFEIQVSELQSKEKLSQNKKEGERQSIIASLSNSKAPNKKLIAEYMALNEQNSTIK
ncbi:MAG: transcriptional regulator [Patiriisocius sp.]|jgi:transcriptional regulator